MKKLEKSQLVVVAFTFALLLLVGGTYAYFSINATSDKTGAKVTGKANNLGNPTMQIKTSKLYLNLDANLMSQANAGKTYYANENESGLALETNPNYTLATAQLPEGDEALDCTYNYKVTATVTTPITDNSDSDVKVVVGDKTMTLNAHPETFYENQHEPMSQGTRSHQLAMYVVYESPLQMISDSPTKYDKNLRSFEFIKSIPTTWDETVPLEGEVGEYIALARRHNDTWYIGVINGATPRHIEIDLSFIGNGPKKIKAHIRWSKCRATGERLPNNRTSYQGQLKNCP